jgi:hypothetical protein
LNTMRRCSPPFSWMMMVNIGSRGDGYSLPPKRY